VLSINCFLTLILELMRQHSNYLRFRTSMYDHLEIDKKGNCVDLFIYFIFFRGRGNNILTLFYFIFIFIFYFFIIIIFFYVLNFPKRFVLDLR
jgi:hypothetical protein